MSARLFRCRECGYLFKTAPEGWARNADLMCPGCGSDDVSIVVGLPEPETVHTLTLQAKNRERKQASA
jgi:hypothetical protein